MKRLALPVSLTVVMALAFGGLALADHGIKGHTTMKLLDVSDAFAFVDLDPAAQAEGDFSSGDMLIFENNLRNRADTETVGRFVSNCTMAASPGIALCRGSLQLEDGTVELSTTVDFANADRIVSAITGGTKLYRNARGHVILGEQVSETARELTVKLQP